MSATEELRRMLDERGVEWKKPAEEYWVLLGMPGGDSTTIVGELSIEEAIDGTLVACNLTPEQAIAATLGRETCHMRETTLPFVSDGNNDGYYMICSECGFAIYMRRIWAPLKYCSNCGRKVVYE